MALTVFQRNAYASGAFTKSILWNVTDLLLLYYIADIQGLGAAAAGTILFISLVVSGLLDITLALLLDRFNLKYQKVIALSAPVTVLSFALLFNPLPAGADYLFFYYLGTTILFRVGYALMDIPHNAMLGSLTKNSDERTRLSSARIFFNSCAVLVFAAFAGDLLVMLESSDNMLRLMVVGGSCLFMLVNIFLSVAPVWNQCGITGHSVRKPLGTMISALVNNRAFMVLAVFSLVPCIFIPVFYKSSVYFAGMLLHSEKLTTWLVMSLAIGKLIALPGFVKLSAMIEKHHAMMVSLAGLVVVLLTFSAFVPDTLLLLCAWFFACGLCSGGIQVLIWSALPDTIEYGQQKSGIANPALTFGAYHLVMRISDGLSFIVIALILEYALAQPQANSQAFASIIGITAAVGCVGGALILWFYPVTRGGHQQVVTSLSNNSKNES